MVFIEDCSQYDKKYSNPTSAISDETIANPNAQIVGDDMVGKHPARASIDDPKRHYGFKQSLLGKNVSLGVHISNWEMFDDDWGLESKEVSPLGEELILFDRPNEVERGRILEAHRLESILQQQISQRMAPSHHDGLYYMLRRQHKVDDQHHDMPLIYYMEGHKLHFGRREFSLITGFRFGTVSFDLHSSGELKFRNRVFPNKIGFSITNLDIIGVIEDEEIFGKLSDDDAIRLCLLLALEVIFMGRLLTFNVDDTLFSLVENIEAWNSFPLGEHLWCHLYDEIKNLKERHDDEHYYGLFKDSNYVPTYTLYGFVFAFQIWILETFERCESWWIKDPKVIPRALGWSKKSLFTRLDYPFLFEKESRSTSDLRPTIAEYQSSWWIDNNLYFQEFVPRAPPIKEHHGLFETYLSKLEKARNVGKQVLSHERSVRQAKLKFSDEFSSMTSDLCDSLNSMFADLIESADPDEDIGQDYLREEELRLCLEGEEKMRSHAKRIQLCSSSEKIHPKVSWVKIKKYRQQVYDPCTAEFLKTVKPWVEDTSRVLQSMDTVWLSDDIERFLGQSWQIKCEFPWNDDYIVDRNFWLKLVCLDPARKGWLTEEHIDLWVDYMWHVRPENSNWAMVSCYFVQFLLQNDMPLFYANGERYTTTWSEVDQVFIPINETGEHWCLAQFHIMSGEVTVTDI
ncbi:phospholipase-like protein [Tanacetum coccineum]